ncbi:YkgJ family cysteine cluster protein [bacterium]|nr:YkgJ family cysteine cluster protein [bacterium]MCI0602511.1 YkgJ family cysteine cluster protein [bacterium]
MIIHLSKPYTCRYGMPVIDRVDSLIFEFKYFAHCMSCNFCNDWCCWHGTDVDTHNAERLDARAAQLEKYVGIRKQDWYDLSETCEDDEAPGKVWFRTSIKNGACVFLNPEGRGCMLHSFSLRENLDYHDLKPLVCAIFPLTFEEGLLVYADELEEKSLVCAGQGLSLFEGVRSELLYYFGGEMVQELDYYQRSLQKKARASI